MRLRARWPVSVVTDWRKHLSSKLETVMLARIHRSLSKKLYGRSALQALQSYHHHEDRLREQQQYSYIVHYEKPPKNLISELCDKYGSDKGSMRSGGHVYPWAAHSYADFYNDLFGHCRLAIKSVFECGIGTNEVNAPSSMGKDGKPGASLRVWREFFPNAEIFGADIARDILFDDERIKTFYVDQTNPTSIAEMWQAVDARDLDLIIDDGLHTFDAGVCFYESSINRLSSTGLYVIEDVKSADIEKFRSYFAGTGKHVSVVNLIRPNRKLGSNSLIVIRNV